MMWLLMKRILNNCVILVNSDKILYIVFISDAKFCYRLRGPSVWRIQCIVVWMNLLAISFGVKRTFNISSYLHLNIKTSFFQFQQIAKKVWLTYWNMVQRKLHTEVVVMQYIRLLKFWLHQSQMWLVLF